MNSSVIKKMSQTGAYSFLFALFPLLSLYSFNKDMASFSYALIPGLTSIVSTIALLVIFKKVFKSASRAGLFVSLFMFSFLSFGHFFGFSHASVLNIFPSANSFAQTYEFTYYACFSLWIVFLLLVFCKLRKTKKSLSGVTLFLAYFSVILIAIPVLDIGIYQLTKNPSSNEFTPLERSKTSSDFPDIYYIILDGYGREDVLRDIYDFDNSSFTESLKDKGFYVADESISNYPQTYLSIASSLNYEYLDSLLGGSVDVESDDRFILREKISNNNLYSFLLSMGYSFVSLPEIWSGTKNNLPADYVFGREIKDNEFNQMVVQLTPFGASAGKKLRFDRQRKITNQALKHLPEIAKIEDPTFVYSHLMIPHPPFLFDKNGKTATSIENTIDFHGLHYSKNEKDVQKYKEGYIHQLEYASKKITTAIDQIIADSPTPPVIILQSDHGPGSMLDWEDENKTNMHERMSILNAYYLPEKGRDMLYESITPVNSFRVVLNSLFDADLELLDDRSYFARWSRPYDFIDVTQRVESP